MWYDGLQAPRATVPFSSGFFRLERQSLESGLSLAQLSAKVGLKTCPAFKPWQEEFLKREPFGSSTARTEKDTLAPGIRECIRNRGRYVLVSFSYNLTPQQQSTAKKAIMGLIEDCGYRNPIVEVLGQRQLIDLFSLFTSLALKLSGKSNPPFLTVDEWKTKADMVQTLQLSEDQKHITKQIQDSLREFRRVLPKT